jgi:hypothetical protein
MTNVEVFTDPVPYAIIDDLFTPAEISAMLDEAEKYKQYFREQAPYMHRLFLNPSMNVEVKEHTYFHDVIDKVIKSHEKQIIAHKLQQYTNFGANALEFIYVTRHTGGTKYGWHNEPDRPLTMLVYFTEEPQGFTGGGYACRNGPNIKEIPFRNNRVLLIEGKSMHTPCPVYAKPNITFRNSRWALAAWIGFGPQKQTVKLQWG